MVIKVKDSSVEEFVKGLRQAACPIDQVNRIDKIDLFDFCFVILDYIIAK